MIPKGQKPKDVTAHWLIAELCSGVANEMYEILASDNRFYEQNQDRKRFVEHCAPMCKDISRALLTRMLDEPETSQMEKDQIYEALILDASLPKTGVSIAKKDILKHYAPGHAWN